jgi:AcrR family transcriptional regulator
MGNLQQLYRVRRKTDSLKEQMAEFKRRRIKETACQNSYCNGYQTTTIDAIAKTLDMTKPSIYSCFKYKNELLFGICQVGVSLSLSAIELIQKMSNTSAEQLKLAVDEVVRIIVAVVFDRGHLSETLKMNHRGRHINA